MYYTYVWCKNSYLISLIDIGIRPNWVRPMESRNVSNCSGVKTTTNHPTDWSNLYKIVSFAAFSSITGTSISDVLAAL